MSRLIAFGLGLAWAGVAVAQPAASLSLPMPLQVPVTPVPSAPAAWGSPTPTVPPVGHQASACPPAGCGFGEAACGTPLFPGVGPKPGDRTCLNRFLDFVCYRPGPAALPLFTPTPFHAPLRTYFPCKPEAGCAPACTSPVAPPTPAPKVGLRLVNTPGTEGRKPVLQGACGPRFGNGGLVVRSPGCSPIAGPVCYGAVPRPVPLFSGCQTCGSAGGFWATGFGHIGGVFGNLMSCFTLDRRQCTYGSAGEMFPGCAGANCYPTGIPGPTLAGYRMANSVGYPVPMGAYPASQTPAYQQQIAAVPFTNP